MLFKRRGQPAELGKGKGYDFNKFQHLLSFPKTNVRGGFDLIASIFQVLAPLSEVKGAVK